MKNRPDSYPDIEIARYPSGFSLDKRLNRVASSKSGTIDKNDSIFFSIPFCRANSNSDMSIYACPYVQSVPELSSMTSNDVKLLFHWFSKKIPNKLKIRKIKKVA